jgi:transketolase N-terminal domain/subunit
MSKIFKGVGIVWDAEKGCTLIDFTTDHVQEISDQRTIDILEKNGFQGVDPPKEIPATEPTYEELKAKAKALGIKIQGVKKDDLLAIIKQTEANNEANTDVEPEPAVGSTPTA